MLPYIKKIFGKISTLCMEYYFIPLQKWIHEPIWNDLFNTHLSPLFEAIISLLVAIDYIPNKDEWEEAIKPFFRMILANNPVGSTISFYLGLFYLGMGFQLLIYMLETKYGFCFNFFTEIRTFSIDLLSPTNTIDTLEPPAVPSKDKLSYAESFEKMHPTLTVLQEKVYQPKNSELNPIVEFQVIETEFLDKKVAKTNMFWTCFGIVGTVVVIVLIAAIKNN